MICYFNMFWMLEWSTQKTDLSLTRWWHQALLDEKEYFLCVCVFFFYNFI